MTSYESDPAAPASRPDAADGSSMPLAICAIFRDEAPYLKEWIEFHRLVGFDRFYLYQNNSEDNWQAVLQPYIERNIVTLIDWPYSAPTQLEAYQHFVEQHKGQHMEVAVIDCDEFLFSPSFPTVSAALSQLSSDWGAVAVNWMCFGASKHEFETSEPVIERFTLRPPDDFGPNVHIKSIVRMDRVQSVGPDPHHFNVDYGTFNESGERVSGPYTTKPSHHLLRINHYVTKSHQEFLRRIARGRVDMANSYRVSTEYDGYQAATVEDRAAWRFLAELNRQLGR